MSIEYKWATPDMIDLLVSRSYGKFDEEDEFTKIDKNGRPLYEKFVNTDAYDKLIIELIQSEKNIVSFLTGVMPKNMQGKIEEEYKQVMAMRRLCSTKCKALRIHLRVRN